MSGFYDNISNKLDPIDADRLLFFPVDEHVPDKKRSGSGKSFDETNGRQLQVDLLKSGLARPEQVLRLDTTLCHSKSKWKAELLAYSKFLDVLAPSGPDLLIFGVGEDGHIASLFPNRKELGVKTNGWLEVHKSPKPPAERVSLSPKFILSAKEIWLVFRGIEKIGALENFLDKKTTVRVCPAKLVLANHRAKIIVWTDIKK